MAVDVVIAGGGPNGLMLACEMRLAGVHPVVLEQLPEPSEIPKANGLVGQIVRMLDYRGLLERFAAEAPFVGTVPQFHFGTLSLDLYKRGASPLHILPIPQRRLERLLADRARELGANILRGHELIALSQDDEGVTLDVRGPGGDYQLRTRYLVGCDGAHSLVRKQANIDFPGTTSHEVTRIGRVTLPASMIVPGTGELEVPGAGRLKPFRPIRTENGTFTAALLSQLDPTAATDVYIISTHEEDHSVDLTAPMTLEELQGSVRRVLGADLPMTQPQWLSRTVGNSRQADRYRAGRGLLAGDAAHVFAAGGSALNVGLMDAVNLGWKLAAEVRGWAPPGLLDTYHTERHAVGKRVLMHTRAQTALSGSGEETEALRELLGELLEYEQPLRHIAEALQGADVHYDMPSSDPHPHSLPGRWAADLALETADGTTRVAELMRAARGVLLDFTADSALAEAVAKWNDRVTVIAARAATQPAPAAALLIRPDGYVVWAAAASSPSSVDGLQDALRTWFGVPV